MTKLNKTRRSVEDIYNYYQQMHWHSKGLELGNKQYNSVKVFIPFDLLESPLAICWKERSRNTHKDPFTVTFITVIFIAMRNLGGGGGDP